MKKMIINLLLVLLVIYAEGCSIYSPRQSILEISTCELPCWLGIKVGATNLDQLKEILSSHPQINQSSISYIENWYQFEEGVRFTFFEKNNKENAVETTVLLNKGTVTFIKIYGSLGINVQQVIDIIGNPDTVQAAYEHGGDVEVNLIFSNAGLHTVSRVPNEHEEINSDSQLTLLDIFEPNQYQEVLESGFLLNSPYNLEEKNYFPWDGFGIIEEKYWPPRIIQ